jgi:hypothetical protein
VLSLVSGKLEAAVRLVAGQRRLWERAKYLFDPVLLAQTGNDLLRETIGTPAAIGKIGSGEMAALSVYCRRADSEGLCDSWGAYKQESLPKRRRLSPRAGRILEILQGLS